MLSSFSLRVLREHFHRENIHPEEIRPEQLYNSQKQITKLTKAFLQEVLKDAVPCTLEGYRRTFAGISTELVDGSVATVIKDEQYEIKSYAALVKEEDMKYSDYFEDYPSL